MLLRMEDTRSVASWAGAQELITDRILTVDDVVERMEKVTGDDLKRVARELIVTEKLNLAVVGPRRGEKALHNLLKL